jgi:protein-disulfide isomerase
MSARQGRKAAVPQARLARETRARAAASRRRAWLGVAVLAVIALVAWAVAISGGGGGANAALGRKLTGASLSSGLFAGIPQHGTTLGRANAPLRIVEFADLQCPYCREYAVQALPSLVRDYVRTGKAQLQFENLSFIGPDSVRAGHVAAAAAAQNKLWNFVDLMYLNQGTENTGYATSTYLRHLLAAIPGLNVAAALSASQAPAADAALEEASRFAAQEGISGTPSFLIGRVGAPLRRFEPPTLTAAPFASVLQSLLGAPRQARSPRSPR